MDDGHIDKKEQKAIDEAHERQLLARGRGKAQVSLSFRKPDSVCSMLTHFLETAQALPNFGLDQEWNQEPSHASPHEEPRT